MYLNKKILRRYLDRIGALLIKTGAIYRLHRENFIPDARRRLLGEKVELSLDFFSEENGMIHCTISVVQINHWSFLWRQIVPISSGFEFPAKNPNSD